MRRVIVLVALLLSSASMASADGAGVDDAADTGDVMDLAHAAHGHAQRGVLEHNLSTHDAWVDEDFAGAYIRLWVDRSGERDNRLVVVVGRNLDGSFSATVHRAGAGFEPGSIVGFGNAFRPSDRTLTLQMARGTLGKKVVAYEWKAFLVYPCSRSGDVTCAPPPPDTHPGRVLHELNRGA